MQWHICANGTVFNRCMISLDLHSIHYEWKLPSWVFFHWEWPHTYDVYLVYRFSKICQYAELSEGTEHKKSSVYSVECVFNIELILSIIFCAMYGAVCFQITDFSYDSHTNLCAFPFYRYEIEGGNHQPLYRAGFWSKATSCLPYYVPYNIAF